jgi:hypothetical protein
LKNKNILVYFVKIGGPAFIRRPYKLKAKPDSNLLKPQRSLPVDADHAHDSEVPHHEALKKIFFLDFL